MVARLAFAKAHKDWSTDDWKRVLFTDESSFNTRQLSMRPRVSRRDGEAYAAKHIAPRFALGGVSCGVWGGITGQGKTELFFIPQGKTMNMTRYLEVLKRPVKTFMVDKQQASIYMQDNARYHTANGPKH